MILPPDLAAALGQLPFAGLGPRHSSLGHALGEIARLTAPSSAAGVSATGACVEQVAAQPVARYAPSPQRQPQLVLHEQLLRDDGICRLCLITGYSYR